MNPKSVTAMQIEIRHLSGSRVNQVERFPVDKLDELTLGREPSSTIAFDVSMDDRVSRHHAVITILKGAEIRFKIRDLGSSNGTKVNGMKIEKETELLPDDSIELGSGGPTVIFDVQPRPRNLIARTRIIPAADGGASAKIAALPATRISIPLNSNGEAASSPTKRPGVGHETVQRMLGAERKTATRKWAATLGVVTVLIGCSVGGLYYKSINDKQILINRASDAQTATEQHVAAAMGLSPADIVKRYAASTVYIEAQWRLYDQDSLKPVFQKALIDAAGEKIPCYVKLSSGKIVPWLTTDDTNNLNIPIGVNGTGTGFVVNSQGYILTNKHVAAGWRTSFNQWLSAGGKRAVLFNLQTEALEKPQVGQRFSVEGTKDLDDWKPEDGGIVFQSGQPIPAWSAARSFVGKNESLQVRFPGKSTSLNATLVNTATEADAALIKVESPEALTPIPLAQNDNAEVGAPVTVIGYPGSSMRTFALIRTAEGGAPKSQLEEIPQPTVVAGIISRLGQSLQVSTDKTVMGTMGNLYQLSAPASAGSSGGPVFNADGQVIAIFSYVSALRETTTMAVPIVYARGLLAAQR